MTDCGNREKNLKNCTCSYTACGLRGLCCACVQKHLRVGEVPGCFFTPEGERTYDRSIAAFIKNQSKQKKRNRVKMDRNKIEILCRQIDRYFYHFYNISNYFNLFQENFKFL